MFDLSPLYRSTIGFDRFAQLLDDMSSLEAPTYPPYNIERVGEDEYRITMAVAGFGEDDVNIEVKQNTLTDHRPQDRQVGHREDGVPASGHRCSAPSSAGSSLPTTSKCVAPRSRTACFM